MKTNLLFKTTKPLKVEGWWNDAPGDDLTIWEAGAKLRYWAVLLAEALLNGTYRRGNVN